MVLTTFHFNTTNEALKNMAQMAEFCGFSFTQQSSACGVETYQFNHTGDEFVGSVVIINTGNDSREVRIQTNKEHLIAIRMIIDRFNTQQ